jgi:hypothetical protein
LWGGGFWRGGRFGRGLGRGGPRQKGAPRLEQPHIEWNLCRPSKRKN